MKLLSSLFFTGLLTFLSVALYPRTTEAVQGTGASYFPLAAIQTNYSSTNVGTTYVQLFAATSPMKINAIQVADSGGTSMILGFGPSCTSITATLLVPKNFSGTTIFPVGFPPHTAICIKSTSGTVSSGENDLNVFY